MIQWMLAIWSLVPLTFVNPVWILGSSWFMHCWSLAWKILNFADYFASMWDECNCAVVWTFFGIAFLWDWDENWLFPVLWSLLSWLKICQLLDLFKEAALSLIYLFYFYFGKDHSNPPYYACLENPMDRVVRWARDNGVAESDMTEATEHITF